MSRRRAALALGLGLVLLGALASWRGAGERGRPGARPAAVAAARPAPRPLPSADSSKPAPPPPLPRSLRGTDVDGALAVDADGHFVPTPDAIALFDYFLAASGEEPPEMIRARIEAEIDRRLAPEAAAEARALLDRYLGFREALRALAEGGAVPAELERRLQWIRELRREHFGAETAAALFAEEETVAMLDLERRRVALDPALEAEEREAALEAIDAALPEHVRAVRERTRAPSRVHAEVAALREAGASDAEVHAVRAEAFGDEAAERLAALDAERAAWAARLDAYRAERAALLEAGEADPAALDALRARHFDEREQLRVRELDRAERAAAVHSGGVDVPAR